MKTVSKSATERLSNGIPAANADLLNESNVSSPPPVEAGQSGGWDAYEVWNRLIKEARERRRSEPR